MRAAVAALCGHHAKGVDQAAPGLDIFGSDDDNDLMHGILALHRRTRLTVSALGGLDDDWLAKSSHEIARHLPVDRPASSSAAACVLC